MDLKTVTRTNVQARKETFGVTENINCLSNQETSYPKTEKQRPSERNTPPKNTSKTAITDLVFVYCHKKQCADS